MTYFVDIKDVIAMYLLGGIIVVVLGYYLIKGVVNKVKSIFKRNE